MDLPPQVQKLVDGISALPGTVACYCGPKPLSQYELSHLSLPGEFGDLPQVAIRRTEGGRDFEVLIQTEVHLDRTANAWLTLEFLAWWVRDLARSGHDVQMRPMALPPKANHIQLGSTLKFLIEYFVIEEGEEYTKTLEAAEDLGNSIATNFVMYGECFSNPAEYTGETESI